jgi:hypothetical protein
MKVGARPRAKPNDAISDESRKLVEGQNRSVDRRRKSEVDRKVKLEDAIPGEESEVGWKAEPEGGDNR